MPTAQERTEARRQLVHLLAAMLVREALAAPASEEERAQERMPAAPAAVNARCATLPASL